MRLQGRNTTATVRLASDLPNLYPVRLQVGPGLAFTLSAREATGLATPAVPDTGGSSSLATRFHRSAFLPVTL
jgi:hypothetical protein